MIERAASRRRHRAEPERVLVFAHLIAVAADVEDVAVVQQPVDVRRGT